MAVFLSVEIWSGRIKSVECGMCCDFPYRFLYCLQLCDDIRANRVHVDRETAIRLTALMLQGVCSVGGGRRVRGGAVAIMGMGQRKKYQHQN